MSVDDVLQEAPKPSAVRVFLRRFLVALLFAAPSIGSWFTSNVIYLRLDELERPLKTESVTLKARMGDLERFVAQFQANELGRGTLNLLMTAVSADMKLRYLGDNLYRANAVSIGSLRRAAAIVYPKVWQSVLKPYEETIAQGYDSPAAVQPGQVPRPVLVRLEADHQKWLDESLLSRSPSEPLARDSLEVRCSAPRRSSMEIPGFFIVAGGLVSACETFSPDWSHPRCCFV
jgi:hypothetical protein